MFYGSVAQLVEHLTLNDFASKIETAARLREQVPALSPCYHKVQGPSPLEPRKTLLISKIWTISSVGRAVDS